MAKKPDFDLQTTHKYFSANCFNAAWEFIEKKELSAEEREQMIRLGQASLWHWTQRDDCTDRNLSVGCWQLSRIYALTGDSEAARRYGNLSLSYAKNDEPFYKGYAYEALARAESVAGNSKKAKEFLSEARKLSEQVEDAESKKFLVDDLGSISIS